MLDGVRPGRVGFSNNRGLFPSQPTLYLRHSYQSLGEVGTVEKSRGLDSQQTKAKNADPSSGTRATFHGLSGTVVVGRRVGATDFEI